MRDTIAFGIALLTLAAAAAQAQTADSPPSAPTRAIDPALVGTWTTKSRKVFTGPGVYDPVQDKFTEPALPGISYSFTSDGFYEEVYYRAVENPTDPNCAQGVMQWQHGEYVQLANNSLSLSPFDVDGRQLLSDPCAYPSQGIYTRYSQPEFFLKYEVVKDRFHGVQRLNLYKFDGSPMIPMYLAYSPTPQMLPTITLNPTATGKDATATESAKSKRDISEPLPYGRSSPVSTYSPMYARLMDPDRWWYFGVGATAVGGLLYLAF